MRPKGTSPVTRIPHMICSPRAESPSAAVIRAFVDAYLETHRDAEVDELVLWRDPVPAYDGDRVAAKMTVISGGTPTGAQATAGDSNAGAFECLAGADPYVLGGPMGNAGNP